MSADTPTSSTLTPDDSIAKPASPPTPSLRPYQSKLIKDLYTKLGQGNRRVAIIAGTGAGKTVIGGKICADTAVRGCRLLFIVHLDVLVGQTYQKMKAFGLHCGFIKSGWKEDPTAPIQIASIQTMAQRDWWRTWKAHVVFFDEGHTTVFSQVGQDVIYRTHPKSIHLAMTATPYRLGKDQLGDHMDTFVASPPPAELQQMGFLATMKYFGVDTTGQVNLSDVKTVAGDFDERDLKNACDRPELVDCIVEEWHKLTPGKRTIAFCVDLDHARHVAEAFRAQGVPADVVDGSTPLKERDRLYKQLGTGELLVLTSCNVISIGFDEPSVEVGLLLRPTQSRALHIQQIGRVMRISPHTGKTHGMILDQAGNLARLGFPEDVKDYRLPTRREGSPHEVNPNKQCPQCNRLVWGFVLECPECGHSWEKQIQIQTGEMVEVESEHQKLPVSQQQMIEFFQAQRRIAFQEGAAQTWARRVFYNRFELMPEPSWCRDSIFGATATIEDKFHYRDYLMAIAQRQGKDIAWVIDEFQQEFGATDWEAVFFG